MSKSVLPEGYGNEPGASWMRYQMAVTKRKESEPHSSSKYATYDGEQPTVDFESFIGDENIQREVIYFSFYRSCHFYNPLISINAEDLVVI